MELGLIVGRSGPHGLVVLGSYRTGCFGLGLTHRLTAICPENDPSAWFPGLDVVDARRRRGQAQS
jgi:hypothetical protein